MYSKNSPCGISTFLLITVAIRIGCHYSDFHHYPKNVSCNFARCINSTFLVFLEGTSPEKTQAAINGWLQQADQSFIFSSFPIYNALNQENYSIFRLKTANPWVRMRIIAGYAFWKLPLHADWYIFTKDDNLLIMDQFKSILSSYDADKLYVGTVGTENFEKPKIPINSIFFYSRAAFKYLMAQVERSYGSMELFPECSVASSLARCFPNATFLNFDMDEMGKYRYFPLNRHFSPVEMKDFTRLHGYYDDNLPILHRLSPALLSFHNLQTDDLQILDVLVNRLRLWK